MRAGKTAGRRGEHRLGGIDGLRGLAAYAILVFHVSLFTPTGALGPLSPFLPPLQSGVTLFFVLSGFLLYRPIVASILGERPSPSVRRYLWNRLLRIFPAYWLILLVTSLLLGAAVLGADGSGPIVVGPLYDPLLLVQNAFLVSHYRPETHWTGILPAWSLSIELVFYLCLPFLGLLAALAAARARSQRGRLYAAFVPVAVLVAVAVGGKLAALLLLPGSRSRTMDWHTVLDRSFLTHADLFALGMVVAIVSAAAAGGRTLVPRWVHRPLGARVLLYLALPFGVVGYYFVSPYLYEPVVAAAFALVLVRVTVGRADGGRGRLAALLDSRPAVGLGTISYSVFLWNFPVLIFLQTNGFLLPPGGTTAVLGNIALVVLATTAVSIVTYRLVEAPALALKTDPIGRVRRVGARLRASAAPIRANLKLRTRPPVERSPAPSPSD